MATQHNEQFKMSTRYAHIANGLETGREGKEGEYNITKFPKKFVFPPRLISNFNVREKKFSCCSCCRIRHMAKLERKEEQEKIRMCLSRQAVGLDDWLAHKTGESTYCIVSQIKVVASNRAEQKSSSS